MQQQTNHTILLRQAPSQLLDTSCWADIKAFAQTELKALQLLNAPLPEGPFSHFWHSYPEDEIARQRIHQKGRALCAQFRDLMLSDKILCYGYAPGSGVKNRISIDRDDLWPRFATGKITGPDIEFTHVTIIEAAKVRNPRLDNLYAAGNFIQQQMILGVRLTKSFKFEVHRMYPDLKSKELDVLWATVSGRKPGRPRGENNSSN